MTVADLARRTGVPKQTISDWLSGTNPRNMNYVRLVAEELGVSIMQLFFGVSDKEKPGRQPSETIQRYFDFFTVHSVAMDRILDLRTGLPMALSLAWERILGWKRSELMKRQWLDLVHPDDRDQVSLAAKSTTGASGSLSVGEHRLLTADGEYIRVHTKFAVDHEAQIMASISLPL